MSHTKFALMEGKRTHAEEEEEEDSPSAAFQLRLSAIRSAAQWHSLAPLEKEHTSQQFFKAVTQDCMIMSEMVLAFSKSSAITSKHQRWLVEALSTVSVAAKKPSRHTQVPVHLVSYLLFRCDSGIQRSI